jgi:hypothetical protein
VLDVARVHEPDVETAPFIQTMAIDRQNLTNSVWPESSRSATKDGRRALIDTLPATVV